MRTLTIAMLLVVMVVTSVQAERGGLCHPYSPGGLALVKQRVNAQGMIVCKYQDAPDGWKRPGG